MFGWLLPVVSLVGCSLFPRAAPELKPESELRLSCYDWPERPFNRKNNAGGPSLRLETGDPAVDFTLRDTKGRAHRLGDLLAESPVLLVAGSWTCNVFQGKKDEIEKLARRYDGDVQVVLVYTIEAHPKGDPSPYRGRPWMFEYSDREQPMTFEQRVDSARDLDLVDEVLVLVDGLDEDKANPFWCTYGTCPNCAFLVNQDGRLEAVHEWFDSPTMSGSIDALLKRSRG